MGEIRTHLTSTARITQADWVIIGAPWRRDGQTGYMLLASAKIGAVALRAKAERKLSNIDAAIAELSDPKPPTMDFVAEVGDVVVVYGSDYRNALATLLKQWNPEAVDHAPTTAIEGPPDGSTRPPATD